MDFPTNMIEVPGWTILLAGLLCFFFIARVATLLRRPAQAEKQSIDLSRSTNKRIDHINELRRTINLLQRELNLQYDIVAGLRVKIRNDGSAATIRTLIEEETQHAEDDE